MSAIAAWFARIPIRIRVTLAFAAVMAVVFVAVGLFVYLRMGDQLIESLDNSLKTRAGEVSALVQATESGVQGSSRASLIESEESLAQVLSTDGDVLDSTPQLRDATTLDPAQVQQALDSPTFFDRAELPGIEGAARLLATPVDVGNERAVVVVGASLDDRREALASLATLLLIGGPIALILASLAGYGVAAGALRPVDAMRRRAETVSAGGPDERLPVSPAGDELTRLGETLNEMLGRLEAGLERERRFTDDAAHELRTPLALHKSELELALRYGRSEEELRESIASAIEEADRVVQLAEDLLVVARSDQGKLALAPEKLSAGELFGTLRERFGARAAQAGRRLELAGGEELSLEGDRLRLEQALTNMVDNALRHGEGDIRMRACANGRGVELHVEDGGAGFGEDFIDRAFERFSRADVARQRGGSGLGLAIVGTIARAHGGAAGAANPPGGGADVWIELPAQA